MTSRLLVTWCVLVPGIAAAQARPRVDIAPAVADLQSNDAEKMQRAIERLGTSGSPAAVAPLAQLVRRGPPGPLLVPALQALGALARPESQDVLVSTLRHHRAAVRVAAAAALAPVRSPRASRALVIALGDDDAAVRSAAAQALATAGMRDAVEPLLAAFERGNDAAATAIGAFGDAGDVGKLLERIGRVPLSVLLPAFRLYLGRRDVSEAAKTSLVDSLAALGSSEVKHFLESVTNVLPPGQQRLRAHVAEAAGRISG